MDSWEDERRGIRDSEYKQLFQYVLLWRKMRGETIDGR